MEPQDLAHKYNEEMQAERDQVLSDIAVQKHKVTLLYTVLNSKTHIMRLPVELLAKVFSFCSDLKGPDASPPRPFLLGWVCHSWRAIAESTPRIWSDIYLTLLRRNTTARMKLLEEWLRRSRSQPLRITIDGGECGTKGPMDEECYNMLIGHCNRWKALVFKGHSFPALLARISRDARTTNLGFPLLTCIRIRHRDCVEDLALGFGQWILNCPPALRRLQVFFPTRPSLFDVNWGVLQHLTASFDVADFYFVTKAAPSLQTCSLLLRPSTEDQEASQEPLSVVTLPVLAELRIYVKEEDEPVRLSDVLSRLSVPALRHFEVNTGVSEESWVSPFISMVVRSDSHLDRLILVTEQLSESDLVTLFHLPNLSSLTHVHVDSVTAEHIFLSNKVLDTLDPRLTASQESSSACLLKLKVMSYAGEFDFDSIAGTVSMIKSRAKYLAEHQDEGKSPQTLQHVRIAYRNYHQEPHTSLLLDTIGNSSSLVSLARETGTNLVLQYDDTLKDSDYYFHHYHESPLD